MKLQVYIRRKHFNEVLNAECRVAKKKVNKNSV